MPSWPSMTSALSTGYTFGQVIQYQLTGYGASCSFVLSEGFMSVIGPGLSLR